MSDKQDVFAETHLLRRAILDLSRRKVQLIDHAILPLPTRKSAPSESSAPIDVVITPNEITPLHGTGVLISRIFGEKEQIFSLRSRNDYGEHSFGTLNVCLTHSGLSRSEAFSNVVQSLSGQTPRRALCVPFYSDDALSALAVRQTYGVPLCTYIMDDNNVASRGIPDDLMAELLENSALRLAISPELREAYEEKYRLKFWLLPPVVAPEAIAVTANDPKRELRDAKRGILIGNIWSRNWLSALRATVRNSGLRVDWYGKLQEWLKVSVEELSEDGIDARGFIAESELASLCRSYPYALIPSGTLDHREDHPAVARFSLPSRMPFILAACNTPMIVLGSSATAAARFVERLEVGIAASYDARAFQEAVEIVSSRQQEFRERAVKLAERFSARDVAGWIWKSLALGQACDSRFEGVMPRTESDRVSFLESPAPKGIRRDSGAGLPGDEQAQERRPESRFCYRRRVVNRRLVRCGSKDLRKRAVRPGRSLDFEIRATCRSSENLGPRALRAGRSRGFEQGGPNRISGIARVARQLPIAQAGLPSLTNRSKFRSSPSISLRLRKGSRAAEFSGSTRRAPGGSSWKARRISCPRSTLS